LLIDSLSFPPIAGAKDTDAAVAIGEAHRHDATADLTETKVPPLGAAMLQVLGDHAARAEECPLRLGKEHAVLGVVKAILGVTHLKLGSSGIIWTISHI
jgi:hypothetical protein